MATELSNAIASCLCGSVQVEVMGTPIMRVVCYCDDCQEGSRQVAALPRAPNPLGSDGGTDYVLYRKDRVRCTQGEHLLRAHKIKEKSATSRYVATCCNAVVYMSFDDARHWIPVYAARFQRTVGPVAMRICAKFAPRSADIPRDSSIYQGYPLKFMARLVAAWIPMLLRR